VTGQCGEQFGVDGAEESLDLAATLGSPDRRVDDADVQGDRVRSRWWLVKSEP